MKRPPQRADIAPRAGLSAFGDMSGPLPCPLALTTMVPASTTPSVDLHDVVAVAGSFPVLAGVTLRVDPGEIVLLFGPNGAGKTSLLRLCAGLLRISRGTGTVCGVDLVAEPAAVGRHVGLIGHRNGLYLELSAAENLRFWGATVGATAAEVDAALATVGITGRLADVAVKHMSAGQRRRTALACLIARRAQVWLLDEPHAGLDAAARDQLDATLRQAVAAGATVLLASHELERADALADRAVAVVGGGIAATDVKSASSSERRAPGSAPSIDRCGDG